jgi:beta-glucosidase/6-phospho-beta-glucosidase/beta-galactosidase
LYFAILIQAECQGLQENLITGKRENIWDYMVHTDPTSISGNATGDVAFDSYHLYQTDVQILKDMGVGGEKKIMKVILYSLYTSIIYLYCL